MKTTGVIRKLDELGRITLPIELRRSLDLDVKDGLEITVQDDCIILKKAECADIFTGSTDDLLEYEGKKVSRQSVVAVSYTHLHYHACSLAHNKTIPVLVKGDGCPGSVLCGVQSCKGEMCIRDRLFLHLSIGSFHVFR